MNPQDLIPGGLQPDGTGSQPSEPAEAAQQNLTLADPQGETPLFDQLQGAAQRQTAAFHTPGHRAGRGAAAALRSAWGEAVLRSDLPELPELDNLFAPRGAIAAAQRLAAQAFGAERTWFLANGSTAGVMAAILASCGPEDALILPRQVHRSVISGLVLSGARPVFVAPAYDGASGLAGGLTAAAVAAALAAHPSARAVLLVSPTYEGICGETAAIAHLCQARAIPLLVDEAHGPHFGFHPALPQSALALGADLAVQSTHKVLSALTQAAMLHGRGDRLDPDRIAQALALVQSTSPSYLLLASLDLARWQMANQGEALLDGAIALAQEAGDRLRQIPGLGLLELPDLPGFAALDPTRLTVDVSGLGLTGFAADGILNDQYGVIAELPGLRHLSFIVSLGSRPEDIDRLVQGFQGLARSAPGQPGSKPSPGEVGAAGLAIIGAAELGGELCCTPREAFYRPQRRVAIAQAIGAPCAETVCPYPPGIPVLLPGERVTAAAVDYLRQVQAQGGVISGCADETLATLGVVG